jgi:glycosyltransferase involved in cell wall biosynthesis
MIRTTFFMEQHLGHRTYYQNLRRYVEADGRLDARWVEVTYWEDGRLLERLPLPKGVRGKLRGVEQVRRGLRSTARDVAFFNTQVPAVFALGVLGRSPYVLATDITPIQYDALAEEYDHKPDRFALARSFKRQVNRRVFQGAAHVVAWSSWVADSLQNDYGVHPDRISVIPPGVDLQKCRPMESKVGQPPLKILFVGGHFQRKGGPLALEAYRRLGVERAELHVVTRDLLPGAPGLRVYNNLTPNSPELLRLYRESDVFLLPTRAEAFGIAAVEASASGLPVIASTMGGLPDIVEDGVTGFLVPPGDVRALSDALEKVVSSPELRQRMGAAARRRAEARFDARRNAERIIAVIQGAFEG